MIRGIPVSLALFVILFFNPAAAGEQFVDNGLTHCERFSEDRTPVPVWSVILNQVRFTKPPSPPPPSAGGTIVYVSLSTDNDDGHDCVQPSDDEIYTFSFPDELKRPDAGGVRVQLRGNVHFQHGDCIFSGFYVSEPTSGIRQGWTDISFIAADGHPPYKDYCLADINPAPKPTRAKVLPACDNASEHRIPVPTWRPELTARGELKSAPPQGDGMIVSISIDAKRDAHGICLGWADGDFKFLLPKEPGSAAKDGLAVTLRGNDSSGPGSCRLSGFYINKPIFDKQDGWTKTFFGSVNRDRLVASGQYCLVR
jgi:hypothetical protein